MGTIEHTFTTHPQTAAPPDNGTPSARTLCAALEALLQAGDADIYTDDPDYEPVLSNLRAVRAQARVLIAQFTAPPAPLP